MIRYIFVYRCLCDRGYALAQDGRTCNDIDECKLSADECDAMATCINTQGSFKCACIQGQNLAYFNKHLSTVFTSARPIASEKAIQCFFWLCGGRVYHHCW